MESWYIYSKKADFSAIAKMFHISPMLARIIRNRDLTDSLQIRKYLHGTPEDLYDPFLLKDMEKGISLTADIVREGGKIRIIGDSDVDGICSSYILKTWLCAAARSNRASAALRRAEDSMATHRRAGHRSMSRARKTRINPNMPNRTADASVTAQKLYPNITSAPSRDTAAWEFAEGSPPRPAA